MKILFITNYYPNPKIGGIERVTKIISESLVKTGIECHNIYLHPDGADNSVTHMACTLIPELYDNDFLCGYIGKNNIRIIVNQSNPFYTPFLRQVCDAAEAKLITCLHNSTECKAQPYREAVRAATGIKKCLIAIGYPLFALYSGNKLKRTHRASYRLSELTVLLSKSLIEPYKRVLGVTDNENKLTYINNPLSFSADITPDELHNKQKTVLVVSRLYEQQKKLSILFWCWAEVEKRISDWNLVIVGDGTDRKKYEKQVTDLELKRVTFVGAHTSLPYYKVASIFCMTSIWEGFPMTILESLQMGVVPVVMDSFPSAKELITNGKNGFLVAYPDVKAFADKLLDLMKDDKMRLHMAQECLSASQRFTIDEIGRQWLGVVKEMTGENLDNNITAIIYGIPH